MDWTKGRLRRGVDVAVADGVRATLEWVNPGWQVRAVSTDAQRDLFFDISEPANVFTNIAAAVSHIRKLHSGALNRGRDRTDSRGDALVPTVGPNPRVISRREE
jgi:hypothetical protein